MKNDTIVQSSTTMMAFPKEQQEAKARAAKERSSNGTEHFPIKKGLPSGVPMAQPVADRPLQRQEARPAVSHNAPSDVTRALAQGDFMPEPSEPLNVARMIQEGKRDILREPAKVMPTAAESRPAPLPIRHPTLSAAFEAAQPKASQAEDEQPIEADDQLPNPGPGFTAAVSDGVYTSVALPSRFAFYPFKDLYVREFQARHLAKLQRAHNEANLLPIVEALSDVIYTSDERYKGYPLAFELTMPDFFFVLYWIRMNGFTKSNYVHSALCNNKEHNRRVLLTKELEDFKPVTPDEVKKYKLLQVQALPPESLNISTLVSKTMLEVHELLTIPNPDYFSLGEGVNIFLRPPSMRDVIELTEAPAMRDPAQREEFAYLAQLASHVQHRDPEMYLPLEQRVDIISNASADEVATIKAYERAIKPYGVDEYVEVHCKQCGHRHKSKLNFGPHSFFL